MSWDSKQETSRRYYYRSRRVGGKVLKQYLGRGEAAQAAAHLDQVRQAERKAMRVSRMKEEARLADAKEALTRLCEVTRMLTHAVLAANGYYLHHGQWRLRHGRQAKRRQGEATKARANVSQGSKPSSEAHSARSA